MCLVAAICSWLCQRNRHSHEHITLTIHDHGHVFSFWSNVSRLRFDQHIGQGRVIEKGDPSLTYPWQ